jgi:hypothetical protein
MSVPPSGYGLLLITIFHSYITVNLKTGKQIGLTIPQSVLYRADKVIK